MQPVGKTSAIYLLREEVGGSDLDKDKERVVVAVTNFGGQTNGGEGLDELDEAGFSFCALYGVLVT